MSEISKIVRLSPQGPSGPTGAAVLNGAGAPSNGTGVNGDFYLDTTNTRLYGPKAGGAWPGGYVSLVGPAGPDASVTAANVLTAVQAMSAAQEFSTRQALQLSRAAASGALTNLASLSFTRTKLERKINPIPDEFIVLDTRFESSADLTVGVGVTLTPGTGLAISKNGVFNANVHATAHQLIAPCIAVEMTVNAGTASGAAQYVACGITLRSATAGDNYIAGFWNKAAGNVGLDIKRGGTQTATTGSAFAPSGTFKLLTLIYGNTVSIMADQGNGWTLVHLFSEALATPWNLRTDWDSNNFAPMVFGFASSGSFTVTRLRAGYAGHLGLQSLCYAKHEDGSPVINAAGKYYMHAMANLPYAAGSAESWAHTHGMVFEVDPTTYAAKPTAQFFPYREGEMRMDDGFGNLILDRSTGRWNWVTQNSSQLGDVNAKIINYYSTGNLLHGSHLLTDWHEVVVPGNKPRWDADAVKIGSTWYVGYTSRTADLVGGTFFPALASSDALDGTFTAVGSDPTQTSAEGVHFARIGGTYYVLSSNDAGLLAYDMTMTLQRTIVPTGFSTGSSPHPHFNLVALPVGNRTRYVIETFNRTLGIGGGNGTYGDREIYEATLCEGNEFAVDSVFPRA